VPLSRLTVDTHLIESDFRMINKFFVKFLGDVHTDFYSVFEGCLTVAVVSAKRLDGIW